MTTVLIHSTYIMSMNVMPRGEILFCDLEGNIMVWNKDKKIMRVIFVR